MRTTTSASSPGKQTKIFGLKLGIDPKLLGAGLVVIVALVFWLNSRSDDTTPPTTTSPRPPAAANAGGETQPPATRARAAALRRRGAREDRGTLRLRTIDATRGDVDPVLRLDLLSRLQTVEAAQLTRNIFETGAEAAAVPVQAVPVRNIPVKPAAPPMPPPSYPATSQAPTANIPYRYYGFVKTAGNQQANRGFFLEGENVLVGSEGELMQGRYKVVQLTPASARMEDIQVKASQTLPVVPEAMPTP